MSVVMTSHSYSSDGSVVFEFECPRCDESMGLSDEWDDARCGCGATWRLSSKAYSNNLPEDD